MNPKFGDIIENEWASISNPNRKGYFVRSGVRTGLMNRGKYYQITNAKGKFWELMADGDSRLINHGPGLIVIEALESKP